MQESSALALLPVHGATSSASPPKPTREIQWMRSNGLVDSPLLLIQLFMHLANTHQNCVSQNFTTHTGRRSSPPGPGGRETADPGARRRLTGQEEHHSTCWRKRGLQDPFKVFAKPVGYTGYVASRAAPVGPGSSGCSGSCTSQPVR